jgi:hypothetical protein
VDRIITAQIKVCLVKPFTHFIGREKITERFASYDDLWWIVLMTYLPEFLVWVSIQGLVRFYQGRPGIGRLPCSSHLYSSCTGLYFFYTFCGRLEGPCNYAGRSHMVGLASCI